jgi:hypothetical protein
MKAVVVSNPRSARLSPPTRFMSSPGDIPTKKDGSLKGRCRQGTGLGILTPQRMMGYSLICIQSSLYVGHRHAGSTRAPTNAWGC